MSQENNRSDNCPSWERQYRTARLSGGFYPVPGRALTALRGDERDSFLHGMVVSDIHGAPAYSWTVSACLNPKGKLISDMALYHLPDAIWIETEQGMRETAETTLRRYALRAAIVFEDLSETWSIIDIVGMGPDRLSGPDPEPGQVAAFLLDGASTFLARTDFPVQPSLRWLVPTVLLQAAMDRLAATGATSLEPQAAAALRMEAGIPIFGCDVGTDNLVMEVPHYRAGISYEKGCYIGQETVARLHTRGDNIARHLRGILTDEPVPAGATVRAGERVAGKVTTTTWSPAAGRYLSLAMIHRTAAEPGTAVRLEADGANQEGTVTGLPLQEG